MINALIVCFDEVETINALEYANSRWFYLSGMLKLQFKGKPLIFLG